MPASIISSGTQTAILNTDHTIFSVTAPSTGGNYIVRVRTGALVNGETLILRVQSTGAAGDALEDAYESTFIHAQQDPIKFSPLIVAETGAGIACILRQEGGTGRAFKWALLRVDA